VWQAGQPQNTVCGFVKVSPLALSMQGPNILQTDHRRYESMGSPLYRTPTGGRGPRLLWLLWAEFSSVELLPALAPSVLLKLLWRRRARLSHAGRRGSVWAVAWHVWWQAIGWHTVRWHAVGCIAVRRRGTTHWSRTRAERMARGLTRTAVHCGIPSIVATSLHIV